MVLFLIITSAPSFIALLLVLIPINVAELTSLLRTFTFPSRSKVPFSNTILLFTANVINDLSMFFPYSLSLTTFVPLNTVLP